MKQKLLDSRRVVKLICPEDSYFHAVQLLFVQELQKNSESQRQIKSSKDYKLSNKPKTENTRIH